MPTVVIGTNCDANTNIVNRKPKGLRQKHVLEKMACIYALCLRRAIVQADMFAHCFAACGADAGLLDSTTMLILLSADCQVLGSTYFVSISADVPPQ